MLSKNIDLEGYLRKTIFSLAGMRDEAKSNDLIVPRKHSMPTGFKAGGQEVLFRKWLYVNSQLVILIQPS